MDPATMVLVLCVLGGLLFAGVAILLRGKGSRPSLDVPYRPDPISIDMINMASIKVAGVGGLGLVAMAAAVALGVPRIAQSMAVGIGLGAIGAAIVILRRRRTGALPSSGRGLGANTTLKIEVPSDKAAPRTDGAVVEPFNPEKGNHRPTESLCTRSSPSCDSSHSLPF